jgi:hypothetical protein
MKSESEESPEMVRNNEQELKRNLNITLKCKKGST